jgi:hypothetical protein
MAMTISGTSGVTFPDTSVQAVTATNATNITTGTLPKARLPAGSVLQVQNVYLSSATQLTSAGALHELTTSLRIAFTPVSASSTIYLECYGPFVSPATNGLQYGAFYDVTNSAYVNLPPSSGSRKQVHFFNRTTSADANDADFMYFSVSVANTTTTARTYTVYHGTESATLQFLVSTLSSAAGATYPLVFTITEVST